METVSGRVATHDDRCRRHFYRIDIDFFVEVLWVLLCWFFLSLEGDLVKILRFIWRSEDRGKA